MSMIIIQWCCAMQTDLSLTRKKQPQQLTNARQLKKHVRRNQNKPNVRVKKNKDDVRINFDARGKDKQKEEDGGDDEEKNSLSGMNLSQDNTQAFMSTLSPTLVKFAQKQGLSTENLLGYAAMMHNAHITPQAIVEWIKKQNKMSDTTPQKWEIAPYADMQQNNPEKYLKLALGIIKEESDRKNGVSATAVNRTHTNVLYDQINANIDTFFKGKIAFALHALVTVGIFAWGIYGQIKDHGLLSTNNTTAT